MKLRTMLVAGVMSGTSADGIDVALVRIMPARSPGQLRPRLTLMAHEGFAYPPALRRAVLDAMNSASTSTAALGQLHWRLGMAYADAVAATAAKHKADIDLIGCHGQTLYHQPQNDRALGRNFACTWQAGEMAPLAAACNAPVVSNFRPADMVAGGGGAPLVPLLDAVLFTHPRRARVLQNIGGIANLTAIPAAAALSDVLAFDNGPGNMVIDWLAQALFQRPFDRNGAWAARGRVIEAVVTRALKHPYFRQAPPRTAGREQFGREFAADLLARCRKHSDNPLDALATATALTARSIAQSYAQFAAPLLGERDVDYIVSGGGARNATLMAMLHQQLTPMGCTLATSDGFNMPAEAKEAMAFALLAWMTWHHLPANVPAATGAKRPAILGQVTYV